jgi:hypothetical protein
MKIIYIICFAATTSIIIMMMMMIIIEYFLKTQKDEREISIFGGWIGT